MTDRHARMLAVSGLLAAAMEQNRTEEYVENVKAPLHYTVQRG